MATSNTKDDSKSTSRDGEQVDDGTTTVESTPAESGHDRVAMPSRTKEGVPDQERTFELIRPTHPHPRHEVPASPERAARTAETTSGAGSNR